jgi:hypothetical protein
MITRSGKCPGQIFDSTPVILNADRMPRLGAIHLGPAGRQQKQIDAARNRTLPLEKLQDQTHRQGRRAA